MLGQLVRRLRSEYSFPIAQASVLSRLDRDGRATTSALAAAERIRPQSMAQTLLELEGDGLISRRPDPTDGRRILIELTAAAASACARTAAAARAGSPRRSRRRSTVDEQRTLIERAAALAAARSVVRDAVPKARLVEAAGPRLEALEQEERLVRLRGVGVAMGDEAVLELGLGARRDLPADRRTEPRV